MANRKISELDASTNPDPTAEVPIRAGAANFRVTLANAVKAAVAVPANVGLATVSVSGSYTDLTNQPAEIDGGNF